MFAPPSGHDTPLDARQKWAVATLPLTQANGAALTGGYAGTWRAGEVARGEPGRNDPCPCGSGRKYKRCCLGRRQDANQRDTRYRPTYVFSKDDPRARNLPGIASVSDVRAYIDAVVHRHALFSRPRDEAVLHVARACQTLDVAGMLMTAGAQFTHGFYEPMRRLQDSLKYLVFKVYTRCREGGDSEASSSEQDLEAGGDAISCFDAFSSIHDAVASTEAGFLACTVNTDEEYVRFDYGDEVVELKQRERSLHHHDLAGEAQRAEAARETGAEVMEGVAALLATMQTSTDGQSLTYSVPERALGLFLEEASRIEQTECQLPEHWSAGPYTVGDHRKFWRYLRALSTMHTAALVTAAKSRHMPPPAMGSELRLNPTAVARECESKLGVPPVATREILKDLTYDPSVRWTDVMYQPLLPMGSGELVTCRVLIEGNRFERNLLALLPRLPDRRQGEEELKRKREEVMIDELTAVAADVGLHIRPRVKVFKAGKILTDVDMLVWEAGGAQCLAVSLKWFYGPDSLQEVRNHDERYREAVGLATEAADILGAEAEAYSSRYQLAPALREGAKVYPVVVSRTDLPSGLVDTSRCPVVTQSYFARVLRESSGSTAQAVARFPEQTPRPETAEDVERSNIDVDFGHYRFGLPGVEVTWDESDW